MSKAEKVKSISKVLSPNDIGLTGGHQAGILIPKDEEILAFFPKLNSNEKNPRHLLIFVDHVGKSWDFAFIYYNSKLFGGTRNEYRLTRMTKYFRSSNLKTGDTLILTNEEDDTRTVSFKRSVQREAGKLTLSTEWKVINI